MGLDIDFHIIDCYNKVLLKNAYTEFLNNFNTDNKLRKSYVTEAAEINITHKTPGTIYKYTIHNIL